MNNYTLIHSNYRFISCILNDIGYKSSAIKSADVMTESVRFTGAQIICILKLRNSRSCKEPFALQKKMGDDENIVTDKR